VESVLRAECGIFGNDFMRIYKNKEELKAEINKMFLWFIC